MSGLDLISRIFGVGGVKTFEKALAAKGITFTEDALSQALARALGGFDRSVEGLSASFVNTGSTFGLTGGYRGFKTKISPLKPYFEFSNRGEKLIPAPDKIAEQVAWMLSCAANLSNPRAVQVIPKTAQGMIETVSEIAKAA